MSNEQDPKNPKNVANEPQNDAKPVDEVANELATEELDQVVGGTSPAGPTHSDLSITKLSDASSPILQ
jgi:type VI protein secretion system component Hcp